MKIIMSVELSLGYKNWKEKFLANEKFRQENQIDLLAYGHEEGNDNKIWVVMEAPSIEHMASTINKPEMIKLRQEAGAIIATQRIIPLVE
tara:strand:- start:654 stop:923 length:270 start_codon:yes stop_codon:yes gene_type:complete